MRDKILEELRIWYGEMDKNSIVANKILSLLDGNTEGVSTVDAGVLRLHGDGDSNASRLENDEVSSSVGEGAMEIITDGACKEDEGKQKSS
ncbi:MAG: hypothetical protein ACRBG0_19190 [Lewinella sp.]|uniref:hypothetical protein n=1 Tax=Lewinella sp. TaxID=2004506 RepID=UPI003D6B3884